MPEKPRLTQLFKILWGNVTTNDYLCQMEVSPEVKAEVKRMLDELRAEMKDSGLSFRDLGKILGSDYSHLSKILRGKISPSLELYVRILLAVRQVETESTSS